MPSGGKRAGAGNRFDPPIKLRTFKLTDDHMRLLRLWGRGDATAGLRWLIECAELLVRKENGKKT